MNVKLLLLSGILISAKPAQATDLSKYREIQLGSDLVSVAKQTGLSPSNAKEIQRRPGLIQELQWRPQSLKPANQTEPVQEVILSFLDGKLFRIAVTYDRYETEGLTASDIIGALSPAYGTPAPSDAGKANAAPGDYYGNQEKVVARWEDSDHCFELIRSSYGPTFKLVGILKSLEQPVKTAILAAARLDEREAPLKEAAENALKDETERAKLEKARLANKPNFRP